MVTALTPPESLTVSGALMPDKSPPVAGAVEPMLVTSLALS